MRTPAVSLSIRAAIIVVIFCGALIYYLIAVFTTPQFNPWALVAPGVIGLLTFLSKFEYWYFAHQKKFFWMCGGYGTLLGNINFHAGGKFIAKIAIKYRLVKDKKNVKFIKGDVEAILNLIQGNVIIEFVGDTSLLYNHDGKYADLPEGSYLYEGNMNGDAVPFIAREKDSRIKELSQSLSMYSCALEKVRAVNIALAMSADKDAMNASKKINVILKDVSEAAKPMMIQQPHTRREEEVV